VVALSEGSTHGPENFPEDLLKHLPSIIFVDESRTAQLDLEGLLGQ
jgi:hypothetical protein